MALPTQPLHGQEGCRGSLCHRDPMAAWELPRSSWLSCPLGQAEVTWTGESMKAWPGSQFLGQLRGLPCVRSQARGNDGEQCSELVPLFVLECCGGDGAAKGDINTHCQGSCTSVLGTRVGTAVYSQGIWNCIPTWLQHGRSIAGAPHRRLTPIMF